MAIFKHNPKIMKKNFLRLVNLFEKITAGALTPGIHTPFKVVSWWEKTRLLKYETTKTRKRFKTPIMFVPPLMTRHYIYDINPWHSFIGHFLARGFECYILDFGIPSQEDKELTLSDHIVFIRNAVKRIGEISKVRKITICGYSMGGIMSIVYTSLFPASVKNLVVIGAPVDFSKMQPFHTLVKIFYPVLSYSTEKIGNIPPIFPKIGFRLLNPFSQLIIFFELWKNYWDRSWVMGYEAVSKWIHNFIPYPGSTFKNFITDFIRDDKLRKGEMFVIGKKVSLSNIKCPLLVFSGKRDNIAPEPCVSAITSYTSSKEKRLCRVPAGHLGLVVGREAPSYVWDEMVDWLKDKSD